MEKIETTRESEQPLPERELTAETEAASGIAQHEVQLSASDNPVHQEIIVPADDAPISEHINYAFLMSRQHAMYTADWVVETGRLLRMKQAELKAEGEQGWIDWLGEHCPDIHRNTAGNYMRAYEHSAKVGTVNAQSIRQLYIEAGIIKEDVADTKLKPEPTIMDPAFRLWSKFKLYYTNELLEKIHPEAAPQLLAWVRDARKELAAMEGKIVKKFGDKVGGKAA